MLAAWACALAAGCGKAAYQPPPAVAPAPQPGPGPDPDPLYLTYLYPQAGSDAVSEDVAIEARFSRAPDPASLDSASFRLVDEAADHPVPARIEGSPAGDAGAMAYRLLPEQPLEPGGHPYRIELKETICTADGVALDLDLSAAAYHVEVPARFSTRAPLDSEPPFFPFYDLRAVPASASSILLTWFPAVDDRTVRQELRYLIGVVEAGAGSACDAASRQTGPGAWQYTVGGLEPDTEYAFAVRALDQADNRSACDERYVVRARTLGAAESAEVTLVYTADVFGTLEPCG